MNQLIAPLLAAVKKIHKLARVLVRVQFSYDRAWRRNPKAKHGASPCLSFVLKVYLGAGAGYVWPSFFRLSGRTFFVALRAKNYHTAPSKFLQPIDLRLTRNANNVPVPDGAGTWKTVDLF